MPRYVVQIKGNPYPPGTACADMYELGRAADQLLAAARSELPRMRWWMLRGLLGVFRGWLALAHLLQIDSSLGK